MPTLDGSQVGQDLYDKYKFKFDKFFFIYAADGRFEKLAGASLKTVTGTYDQLTNLIDDTQDTSIEADADEIIFHGVPGFKVSATLGKDIKPDCRFESDGPLNQAGKIRALAILPNGTMGVQGVKFNDIIVSIDGGKTRLGAATTTKDFKEKLHSHLQKKTAVIIFLREPPGQHTMLSVEEMERAIPRVSIATHCPNMAAWCAKMPRKLTIKEPAVEELVLLYRNQQPPNRLKKCWKAFLKSPYVDQFICEPGEGWFLGKQFPKDHWLVRGFKFLQGKLDKLPKGKPKKKRKEKEKKKEKNGDPDEDDPIDRPIYIKAYRHVPLCDIELFFPHLRPKLPPIDFAIQCLNYASVLALLPTLLILVRCPLSHTHIYPCKTDFKRLFQFSVRLASVCFICLYRSS